MEKKIVGLIILLFFYSCKKTAIDYKLKSSSKVECFKSTNNALILCKKENEMTVFCDPIEVGKYSCSICFGGIIKDSSFIKGYFLENSKDKHTLFDTVYSNKNHLVNFRIEKNNLIILCKTPQIGCELIFNNSMNYNKPDTLELQKINNALGIAIPLQNAKIRNKKTKEIDIEFRPVLIVENLKDSIEIEYRKVFSDNEKKWIKTEQGIAAKKDFKLL